MRTLKFIRGQQKKSIIISSGNYPNILFPGTLPKNLRILEANYSISSKQYVENGIHMKVLSKGKPNENCVLDNDITLEDAYIYLTNS